MKPALASILALSLSLAGAHLEAAPEDLHTLAKKHFEDGKRAFDARDFRPALEHFRQSYSLAPYPQLLFNIARCLEELGRLAEAVVEYERYLAVAPRDDDARTRVADLRLKIADQPLTLEEPGQPSPSPVPSLALVSTPPPAAERTPIYRRWWFWTAIAGVVVAGAAVGLGVGLSRPSPSLTFPALNAQ